MGKEREPSKERREKHLERVRKYYHTAYKFKRKEVERARRLAFKRGVSQ